MRSVPAAPMPPREALNSRYMPSAPDTAPYFTTPAGLLTAAFALLLAAGLLVRFWLASRQIRHVARHRGAVPEPFAGRIPLAAHQKAADYTIAKARLGLLETALGAAVLLGWTLLGGLDALNQALRSLPGGGMAQQIALLAAFALASGLIDLPLAAYQTFVLEERFGFNKTTPRLWLKDLARSTLMGAAIGLPLAALILWLMGAAGALWWLWAWAAWTAFSLVLMVVYPLFIAPLYNRFQPLADESLKARVTALMQRCGFAAKGLFVMDGSRRSAHANAYFTGFGAAKRVVFYDTLLRQLQPGEVEAVLAHELGHFKHRHIARRMAGVFAMALLGFALLGWLSGQTWFYEGLGVQPAVLLPGQPAGSASNDALALLLFLLATPVLTFFVSPVFAQLSRRDEFEADAYAMAQAEGSALASALLKLYEDNASTLTPDPVYARFYYSHPPASERLARMPLPQPST
ncbi:STE24 endopeptidase [Paracidovorax cattleyae]|uniref:STE24 endopeptidase n=2 Tax=Paracidovorax cattleyae TaxID=80868 RepID=A0A1H0NTC7_9BURK|nr:STE24 endopeptidase [Paracidovorax cattleyae]